MPQNVNPTPSSPCVFHTTLQVCICVDLGVCGKFDSKRVCVCVHARVWATLWHRWVMFAAVCLCFSGQLSCWCLVLKHSHVPKRKCWCSLFLMLLNSSTVLKFATKSRTETQSWDTRRQHDDGWSVASARFCSSKMQTVSVYWTPGCGSHGRTLAKTPTYSNLLPDDDRPLSNSSALMTLSYAGQESLHTSKHTLYYCVFILILKSPETKLLIQDGWGIWNMELKAAGLTDQSWFITRVPFA